jgi:SAM-dependent methyltransferase
MWSLANPIYSVSRVPLLDATTTVGMLGQDRRARAEAVRALALRPGERVLELACGTGRLLPHLADAVGPRGCVVGVDGSVALLRRARTHSRDRRNVELRWERWPSDFDMPVDAAVCVLGLSVIDQWLLAFEQLTRVVRPEGRIVIVDQVADRSQSRLLNGYVRFAAWVADASSDREIIDVARARLGDPTLRSLPLGLWLLHGIVTDQPSRPLDCAVEQSPSMGGT